MHRSSAQTFIFKYLFYPLWAGIFTIGIVSNWNKGDQFSYIWSRGALLMVSCTSVWLIFMMIRLQNVEATEESLTIKTLKGKKIVAYKDIEWISQFAMINPPMISLKYFDINTKKTHKILILLSKRSGFGFTDEAEMTTFIRERIMASRPDYSKESEPSRWSTVILVFASSIPVALFSLYLFSRIH